MKSKGSAIDSAVADLAKDRGYECVVATVNEGVAAFVSPGVSANASTASANDLGAPAA